MKNNLWMLLKINVINSLKLRTISAKKKTLIGLFALYIVGTLIVTFGTFLKKLFDTLNTANLSSYYLSILFAVASLFAFLFTIYSAKSGLFENRDNDLLLSLPLKKSTVLFSRFLYLGLYNFTIGLIFLIPGIYIYITEIGSISSIFILALIFMVICFPIIPTILASLFGYLIAILTSKTKKKNIFELLYYTLFIFIYIYVVGNANKLLLKLTGNVSLLNKLLKIFFLPLEILNKAINSNNILYILYFILINMVALCLFILILNKSYFKIISNLGSQKTKSNFKMKELSLKSPQMALKIKETKRYFSSAIYVFNTAFGVVLLVIVAIASLFYSQDKIMSFISQNVFAFLNPFSLIFSLFLFVCAVTNTTYSAISIERNNFWILKSLPVRTKDIFNAKIFVNRIIILPIVVICLLIFKISGYIDFTQMILLMIITFFYNGFIANFGLIANLLFPNFSALNDTVVVKQSVAAFFGIIIPLLITVIFVIVLIGSSLSSLNILLITIAISVFLYFITKIVLNSWGINKFNKIG